VRRKPGGFGALAILAQPPGRKLVLRLRLEIVGVVALVCNWLEGSPERRLSMRPRFTAGR
jgi:hypothetical protein